MKDNTSGIFSAVFAEYEAGRRFKEEMYGGKGLYAQNRKNERFYAGDQWYGAAVGGDRPLVSLNVIKRIADYKTAMVGAAPVAVSYSAEGEPTGEYSDGGEVSRMTEALGKYYRSTAERVKLSACAEEALLRAFISGTGILYTAWDPGVETGLFADSRRTEKITGDIVTEVLDVENFYLGDPTCDDIRKQPYITVAQRRSVDSLRAEAKANGKGEEVLSAIVPDRDTSYMAGDLSEKEPTDSAKATVLTKFFRRDGRVWAVRCVRTAVIKDEWDTGLRVYPFSVMLWNKRAGCGYGESEIASLIPNQIAINRMATAGVWANMMTGMPITVVNDEIITGSVSNEPGQVIYAHGDGAARDAIGYVVPPSIPSCYAEGLTRLINDTLTQSGANDAALGDIDPDNTSAIVAVREAATLPLQSVRNRYYQFIEDNARIWAEYWVMLYGRRSLKLTDDSGSNYTEFDGNRWQELVLRVRVDVGAATLWSEAQSVKTLDGLLSGGIITPSQYIKRLPKGYVPDAGDLVRELEENGGEALERA